MSNQPAPSPSLPALLRHARRTYGEAMRAALVKEGYDDIPASGLYIIGGLALGDGGVPISRLVKELAISKQAAGQLVDTLVTRGYLKRAPDEADRRQLIVTLTPRGVAAAETQTTARKVIDATLLSVVGGSDLDKTRHTLSALIDIGRPSRQGDNIDNGKQNTSDLATFDDRSLNDAMFRNCAMARARFDDIKLADARFANVDLQRSSFRNVNLTNVVIEDADITGLTIMGHDVSAMIQDHVTGVRSVESERMANSMTSVTMLEKPSVGAFAIVPSNDLSAAIPFWERLGFGRTGGDDNYAIMTGWGCEVHLTQAGTGPWRVAAENNPFGVFIRTPDVAAIAAKVDDLVIRPGGVLRHREWGLYEVGIAGPDGLLVRVGWPSRLITSTE